MTDISSWERVDLPNATVPFFRGEGFLAFNSCECVPPGPMINACVGLNALLPGERLLMQNHRQPLGLLPGVRPYFSVQVREESGLFEIIFTPREGCNIPKFDESASDHP